MLLPLISILLINLVGIGSTLLLVYPKRKQSLVRIFFVLQLIYVYWALTGLLMLIAPETQTKISLVYVRLIALPMIAPLWLILASKLFKFPLFEKHKSFRALIFIIPLFSAATAALGLLQIPIPWSDAFLHGFSPITIWGNVSTVSFKPGWFFHLYLIHSYFLLAMMYFITGRAWLFGPKHNRKTGLVFSFAGVVPIIAEILANKIYPEFRWTQLTIALHFQIVLVSYWIITQHDMFKLKALAKEKILKETPLPILTFSPQNELWDYNRQAEIIFQVTSSSLGKSLNDFSNDWNFTINPGEYIREGRVYLIQEYRLSLQPDSDPARIFTFSDITEIRDLSLELTSQNKTLQHLNQELGRALDFNQQIYSILSHDLSGSLHSVNLLMSGMLQTAKKSGNEEIQSQLDVALRSQQTSLDLLADLLKWNLAQGNSLSQTALRTPSECLTRVIMHLTAQIESRKVTISIDDQFQQFDHQIDSYSFETILRNIVSNAIRYSHVGGKVDISLKSGDKGLRVEVQDRGQGISPNSKKAEEGFGLGLVFTHRYIKALGGELKTFSQATRGTLVVIELPLLAQEVIV